MARAGLALAVLPWCWWAGGTETGTLTESQSLPSETQSGSESLPSSTETASRSLCPEPIVYESRCHVQADCNNRAEVTGWNGTRCVCKCRNQWTGAECSVCPPKFSAALDCGGCAPGLQNYPECRQRANNVEVVQKATEWAYPGAPVPSIQARVLDSAGNPLTVSNPPTPPIFCKARLYRCQMNVTTGDFLIGGTCTVLPGLWYAPVSSTGVCDLGDAVFIDQEFSTAHRYRLEVEADTRTAYLVLPRVSCALELNQAQSRKSHTLQDNQHNDISVGGVHPTDDWRNRCPLCALNFLRPDESSAPRTAGVLGLVLAAIWIAAAV